MGTDYDRRTSGPFQLLEVLRDDADSGLLHEKIAGTRIVQHWRCFGHVGRFASTLDLHRDAWRNYWRRVVRDDRTRIWRETLLVRAGEHEAIYADMPPYGLARAGMVVPLAESHGARASGSGTGSGHHPAGAVPPR